MPNAIAATGTLVARAPQATPTVFTTIGELQAITPPPLSRNTIETTSHNEPEESYVVGIRRKGEMVLKVGFNPADASHDHLTGLHKAWLDGTCDIYRITFPDTNNTQWLFSGYVSNIATDAPIDDQLSADVSIRTTNLMSYVTTP